VRLWHNKKVVVLIWGKNWFDYLSDGWRCMMRTKYSFTSEDEDSMFVWNVGTCSHESTQRCSPEIQHGHLRHENLRSRIYSTFWRTDHYREKVLGDCRVTHTKGTFRYKPKWYMNIIVQSLIAPAYTTCFNMSKLLPSECVYGIHLILRTNSRHSHNSINQLMFWVKKCCVFLRGNSFDIIIR
jgi:hypothetical protein